MECRRLSFLEDVQSLWKSTCTLGLVVNEFVQNKMKNFVGDGPMGIMTFEFIVSWFQNQEERVVGTN